MMFSPLNPLCDHGSKNTCIAEPEPEEKAKR